jgi:hypothetical protein
MDRDQVVFVDRTFKVGDYLIRIKQEGDPKWGPSHATWAASTSLPFREKDMEEGGQLHFTIGTSHHALGAVLALCKSVDDKAEVILHLTPLADGGSITPVYGHLRNLHQLLQGFAWGTVAAWTGHGHPGHPTFEEVEVAA